MFNALTNSLGGVIVLVLLASLYVALSFDGARLVFRNVRDGLAAGNSASILDRFLATLVVLAVLGSGVLLPVGLLLGVRRMRLAGHAS